MFKSKILVGIILGMFILETFYSPVTQAIKKGDLLFDSSMVSDSKKEYKFSDLKEKTFTTDRLIIAPTVEKDYDKLAEYLLDKNVTEYLDPSPNIRKGFNTKEEALKFLKSESLNKEDYEYAIEFTVKLKDTWIPIGIIDLKLIKNQPVFDIGYWQGTSYQGKGYMSEASFVLCNEAFKSSDIKGLSAYILSENKKSKNLARNICDYIARNNEDMTLCQNMSSYTNEYNGEKVSYFSISLYKC